MEGRKSKRRYLTRVSFRYISGERSVVLVEKDISYMPLELKKKLEEENITL